MLSLLLCLLEQIEFNNNNVKMVYIDIPKRMLYIPGISNSSSTRATQVYNVMVVFDD